jgi:plastocyanin
MRILRSLSVITAVLVLVAACTAAKPGWTYAPAPSMTPIPSVVPSGSVAPSASAAPSAPASAPAASASAGAGEVLVIEALNTAFNTAQEAVPADTPFQIDFKNQDQGILHNVEIKDAAGASVFKGEIITGIDERIYDVPPLPAGDYQFVCTVHPNMTGTLTAE